MSGIDPDFDGDYPSETSGDTVTCEWCGGDFLRADMNGEHCRECADDIFGGDEA